ncbi:MAG: pilus assembly protein Flp/PilA [Kiritimatiellia bacterium]|jgi:pilus assembly protein Flp/PilA
MLDCSQSLSEQLGLPSTLVRFVRDEGGATAIEYALVASIISVGIFAGYVALGDSQLRVFEQWTKAVKGTMK